MATNRTPYPLACFCRFSRRNIVLLAIPLVLASSANAMGKAPRPNVLIVLADDMGFSDLGCYGGEMATPTLDALAADGLRYTQFYNTARCWPTRAALLTGYYAQEVGFDEMPGTPKGEHRTRPDWARLLPEYLKPLGYRSYHSGKWHLDSTPVKCGFDRSYALLDYDYNFSPKHHTLDGQPLPPVKLGDGYYSTTAITDRAIEFLKEHQVQHADAPFFEYVAYVVPHFPLQAPPEDIARVGDRYQVGWDEIRQARWKRIEEQLHLPGELSPLEPKIGPPYRNARARKEFGDLEVWHETPWDELNEKQRQFEAQKMAIHAAMIERMDHEVARLVEQLRAMKAYENTLVLFLSDNGASSEIMIRGDGHDPQAPPGSAATFLCLGPGWSNAANTPFRRHKTWVHEGGIATPLIAHWPVGIAAKGELRSAVGHVIDLAPTILTLAGGSWPTQFSGKSLPPQPGKDLSPTFAQDVKIDRDFLWWLHDGNRAIRKGDWKLVAAKGDAWELFDMAHDRAENIDLANAQPEKVQELSGAWNATLREFQKQAGLEPTGD
jgi:arylsulfatase A-like enzyme